MWLSHHSNVALPSLSRAYDTKSTLAHFSPEAPDEIKLNYYITIYVGSGDIQKSTLNLLTRSNMVQTILYSYYKSKGYTSLADVAQKLGYCRLISEESEIAGNRDTPKAIVLKRRQSIATNFRSTYRII